MVPTPAVLGTQVYAVPCNASDTTQLGWAYDPDSKMIREVMLIELQPLVGPDHESRHEVEHGGAIFAYGYSGPKQVYWCEWVDQSIVRKDSHKQGAASVVIEEISKHDIVIPVDHMNKLFMDLPI